MKRMIWELYLFGLISYTATNPATGLRVTAFTFLFWACFLLALRLANHCLHEHQQDTPATKCLRCGKLFPKT